MLGRISTRFASRLNLQPSSQQEIPGTGMLVIIDSKVESPQTLAAGVLPGAGVVILDSEADGMDQITAALSQFPETHSLHIVSHGAPGILYLGNSTLSLDTLNEYDLTPQPPSLPGKGENGFLPGKGENGSPLLTGEGLGVRSIFIYGCNVAAGDAGEEFVRKLHQVTGAGIAASARRTGNPALGGDWSLEVRLGEVDGNLAFDKQVQDAYPAVLVDPNIFTDENDGVGVGGISLRDAITGTASGTINLGAGNYTLSIPGNDDANAKGDLDIVGKTLTIRGQGAGQTFIDAQAIDRVFDLLNGASLILEDVTVKGGKSSKGGGIFAGDNSVLTINNSKISDNQGNGIEANNTSTLTVNNSKISNNQGNGISANGISTLTVSNSTVSGNQENGIRASSISTIPLTFTVSNSTVSGNEVRGIFVRNYVYPNVTNSDISDNKGGGILIGGISDATVSDSKIHDNFVSSNEFGGGGILINLGGTLTVNNSTISNNTVTIRGGGGGIFNNDGTLTVNNSTISNNTVTSENGGGGGIFNGGTLTVANNTTISGNSAVSGGGISNNNSNKTATVSNSTISGNFAKDSSGGGIDNQGNLELNSSFIIDNSAKNDGGGIKNSRTITVNSSTVSGNSANRNAGGIYNSSTATINNSTVSSNSANYDGGGIFNGSTSSSSNITVTVNNSTVLNNSANRDGAGIFNNKSATINSSTVSNNSANRDAGGIFNSKSATINNSTISGNTADHNGSGIYNNQYGTATVSNSTISNNSAKILGGGLFTSGTANVRNTTITGNSAAYGSGVVSTTILTSRFTNTIIAANDKNLDIVGSFISNDNNLIGSGTGGTGFTNGVNGDQVGTAASPIDPKLGPLANNGGPTLTHALLPGSPAIDKGSNPGGLTTDQRGTGFARLIGPAVDIGAFEVQPSTILPTLAITDSVPKLAIEGVTPTQKFTVTLSKASDQVITVAYETQNGTAIAGEQGDYIGKADILTFQPGQKSATIAITINDDLITGEGEEQYSVILNNPTNAIIEDGIGIGKILDNDLVTGTEIKPVDIITNFDPTAKQQDELTLIPPSSQAIIAEPSQLLAPAFGTTEPVNPVGLYEKDPVLPVASNSLVSDGSFLGSTV